MHQIDTYLQELYCLEYITVINEGLSSWIKSHAEGALKDKIQKFIQTKDSKGLMNFLSIVPKTDIDTLKTTASKLSSKFKTSFSSVRNELSKKITVDDNKLDFISFVLAIPVSTKSDIPKDAKEAVNDFKTKLSKAGVKNFEAAAGIGIVGIILAGMLVAGAFATLSIGPLLFALAVVGIAMLFFMS